jgi:hypothetical protein
MEADSYQQLLVDLFDKWEAVARKDSKAIQYIVEQALAWLVLLCECIDLSKNLSDSF